MSSTASAQPRSASGPGSTAVVDITLAVAALAGSLVMLAHGGIDASRPGPVVDASRSGSASLDLAGVVLAAISTVPLVAWRRSPTGVFAVTSAAGALLVGLGYPLDVMLGPAAALYLLAAGRERHSPWTGPISVMVVGLFLAYLGSAGVSQGAFPGTELLHTGLAWAVAWFAGERTRLRRQHMADLEGRARRAERDAERERLLAAVEERARIARDLHDSAGHSISVIAVRAGAARLWHGQDPDRSLLALEAIEDLARQTVEEIDKIVGNLRQGGSADGPVDTPPGLASLGTLVAKHAAAGFNVALETYGVPRPLGGAADQAAYRILQEAITNAVRHGSGDARIELSFDDAAVGLTVTNPVPVGGTSRSGGGHGLIGMRERATMLGGDLDVERAGGAFRVHARIPYGGRRA